MYSIFSFVFLFASEMEEGDNNNNNNQYYSGNNNGVNPYQTYYMGAYCSPKDGKSILLGVFLDAGCSTQAGNDKDVYAAKMYGAELPYADKSMVSSKCISCIQADNDNDNNSEYHPNFSQRYVHLLRRNLSPNTLFPFLSTLKTLKTTPTTRQQQQQQPVQPVQLRVERVVR
jgi:hypothetical protein